MAYCLSNFSRIGVFDLSFATKPLIFVYSLLLNLTFIYHPKIVLFVVFLYLELFHIQKSVCKTAFFCVFSPFFECHFTLFAQKRTSKLQKTRILHTLFCM